MRSAATTYGISSGTVIRQNTLTGLRVKLRAISRSSRSSSLRPSEMLTRQNGVRIATWTKITVRFDGPNQIEARIAQPTDGKELRKGLMRS